MSLPTTSVLLPQMVEVLREVLTRFVNYLEATPRKSILLKLKGFPEMFQLLQRGYFITARAGSQDSFLPTIRTFQDLADEETLRNAKTATGAILSAIQKLYVDRDESSFSAEIVKETARSCVSSLTDRDADIGLILATEFNYFGSWSWGPVSLFNVSPNEDIIHFSSIEEAWSSRISVFVDPPKPIGYSVGADLNELPNPWNLSFEHSPHISDDRRFAAMAIEKARLSVPEDERPHPKVGAVVVKDGKVLSTAYRGENLQCHAEYVALEKKLPNEVVAGSTVYTTLEPCTTRNHPKIPCAQRLVDRKVNCVVIGMLDPNPDIRGRGWQLLRDAGIVTRMFDDDLISQVEDLNREFIRAQKNKDLSRSEEVDALLRRTKGMTIKSGWNPLAAQARKKHGTILISSFSAIFDDRDSPVSYNSGSISVVSLGRLYYVYTEDPDRQGGAVTYQATEIKEDALAGRTKVYIGSIFVPKSLEDNNS